MTIKKFQSSSKSYESKKLGIVVITKSKFIKGLITDGDLRRVLNNPSYNKDLNKITENIHWLLMKICQLQKPWDLCLKKKLQVC